MYQRCLTNEYRKLGRWKRIEEDDNSEGVIGDHFKTDAYSGKKADAQRMKRVYHVHLT